MNFEELSLVLRKEYGFSKTLSQQTLRTVLSTIVNELKHGRRVRLRGFGTFEARKSHGKVRAKFDDSKNFFEYNP